MSLLARLAAPVLQKAAAKPAPVATAVARATNAVLRTAAAASPTAAPVLQKAAATLTRIAPVAAPVAAPAPVVRTAPTAPAKPTLVPVPMEMPVLKATPVATQPALPPTQPTVKTLPAALPVLMAAPATVAPTGEPDVSLLKSLAKVAGSAVRAIPGVGTAIAIGEGIMGVKNALAPRPQLPVATNPPMMLQANVANAFLPSVGRALPTIGRVGGAIGTAIGSKKAKWVKQVVGGVITWVLIDKVTGAILKQSDKAPHRRMNPMNVKALKRADRRICSFAGISRGVLRDLGYSVTSTRKPKGKCAPRGKRRACR
jgi:hypothetical protein